MPRISEFLGMVFYMYYDDDERHHAPHFHAYYGEFAAVYSIVAGKAISGHMPRSQDRRIRKWIEVRREALMDNWNKVISDQPPVWITPL